MLLLGCGRARSCVRLFICFRLSSFNSIFSLPLRHKKECEERTQQRLTHTRRTDGDGGGDDTVRELCVLSFFLLRAMKTLRSNRMCGFVTEIVRMEKKNTGNGPNDGTTMESEGSSFHADFVVKDFNAKCSMEFLLFFGDSGRWMRALLKVGWGNFRIPLCGIHQFKFLRIVEWSCKYT